MPVDLTPVVRAEMMVERLNMPEGYYATFIKHDDVVGDVELLRMDETTTEIDWDAVEVSNLYVAISFVRLRVIDYDGFDYVISEAEKVEINGDLFVIKKTAKPFAGSRVWTFKLVELTDL